eukprot:707583-Alexandrium_andersonii.AAC.1
MPEVREADPECGAQAQSTHPGLGGATPEGQTIQGSEVRTEPSSDSKANGQNPAPAGQDATKRKRTAG